MSERNYITYKEDLVLAGVAELADARDLKSLVHIMNVPVRVRPPAPYQTMRGGAVW